MNDTRGIDSLASASQIVEGKELVNSPESSLMFGRIINVKFIRKYADKNGDRSFCIRSDYEPVYHSDGTVQFVRCSFPPAITITYNQVADTIAISVQIRITGLFIDREVADERIDSAAENPIMSAVVQLGYIDEFPRWDKVAGASDVDAFYDMDNDSLDGFGGMLSGKQLIVQILNCYPENNPPDREWVFVGTVAHLDTGIPWSHTKDDLVPGYNNNNFPKGMSKIGMMFYQWITRRFIRPGIEHLVQVTHIKLTDDIIVDDVQILVWNYNYLVGKAMKPDKQWTKLIPDGDGLLTPFDAGFLGVPVSCSEELRSMTSVADIPKYGVFQPNLAQSNKQVAAQVQKIASSFQDLNAGFQLFDEAHETLESQLNAIKHHFNYIRWYMSLDGSLFVYKTSQSTEGLFKDPVIKERQKNGKVLKLAAVYDITMSGLRIIRCPFRQLINPMTTVLFVSRYRILDTVGSFYQPKETHHAFLVLLSSVKFSTVGDDNEMTLSCVDIPDEDAPVVDYETGLVTVVPGTHPSKQSYTDNPASAQDMVKKAWITLTITVGVYPYDSAHHSWVDVANQLLKTASPVDWTDEHGVVHLPDLARALTDLATWNSPGAWADGPMTVTAGLALEDYSPDNDRVSGLSFKIPWLFDNKIVVIRHPYKNKYLPGYEQKGVTLNG